MASRIISVELLPRSSVPACMHMTHVASLAHRRQRGAFAVMFVPLLMVMLGFCGLALDMGMLYNRKVDLHGLTKAAALAAARELNGTPAGITAAKAAAREVVEGLRYHNYNGGVGFAWNDNALSFSTGSSRSGTWIPALEAEGSAGDAAELFFARVDTAGLAPEVRTVNTYFIKVLNSNLAQIPIDDSAIAGRTSVKVTPIGICAMSPNAATVRTATGSGGVTLSEVVQHGFRRGISYDLMNLNPNGVQPVRFMINPVAAPGADTLTISAAATGPFVCSGSMWVQRVTGGTIRVTELPSSAPLASLRAPLNTRFDDFTSTDCDPSGAAPDINVRSYAYDQTGVVRWMNPGSGSPAAVPTTTRGKLETVADLTTPPPSPGNYGPLWAYARAIKASSSTNPNAPANGYAVFAPSDWPTLYPSGPTQASYPSSPPVPYLSSNMVNGFYQAPRVANRPTAVPHRRVLNIPLLSCTSGAPSGSNAQATVLAIGKFFMTVPATDNSLIGEFAGILPHESLPGHVELFP